MIRIYDTNNWARIRLENDVFGLGIRLLWEEVLRNPTEQKIFVFEGKNGNERRRKLYPAYKAKRELPKDNFFENLSFFRDLLKDAPKNVFVAYADGYEADDVINTLCKNFEARKCEKFLEMRNKFGRLGTFAWNSSYGLCGDSMEKNYSVSVMTTDRDLTQILSANFPMIKKELTDRMYVRTYKTLVGDPSDNITGVKGFGKGTWEKERPIWFHLQKWCEGENVGDVFDEKTSRILERADRKSVDVFWEITGLYTVDQKDMKLSAGSGNVENVQNKLKEFLL